MTTTPRKQTTTGPPRSKRAQRAVVLNGLSTALSVVNIAILTTVEGFSEVLTATAVATGVVSLVGLLIALAGRTESRSALFWVSVVAVASSVTTFATLLTVKAFLYMLGDLAI